MFRVLCLIVGVLQLTIASSLTCPPPSEGSAIRRLKSTLFCDYDPQERPVKDRQNNVSVEMYFTFKHIAFINYENKVELDAYFWMTWKDEVLTWNPEDFENINKIFVLSHNIWSPDVVIVSSDMKPNELKGQVSCSVSHAGEVLCVPQVNTIVYCKQNLTYWPRDKQKCHLIVRLYNEQQADLVELKTHGLGGANSLEEYESYEWDIYFIGGAREFRKEENKTFSDLHYFFKVKRSANLYYVIIITPVFVVTVLTLLSFWADDLSVRRYLHGITMLVNALCLLFIGSVINNTSETSTPNIALFYRDSLFLTMLAAVLGVCVERLKDRTFNIQVPAWLFTFASWLQLRVGRTRQMLLLQQGQDTEEFSDNSIDLNSRTKTFQYSVVANFITFVVFFITYFVILITLVPFFKVYV